MSDLDLFFFSISLDQIKVTLMRYLVKELSKAYEICTNYVPNGESKP